MKNSLNKIGSTIKALRESSGLTQSNIANYLKVDQSLISKFEAGERPISADKLEKLLTLFGASMSIFNETEGKIKPLSLALRANEISEEDLEIVCAINKIALNCDFMTRLLKGEVR
ncbi:MAG: helix-turn-helix transcriptional regulator [Deltaproteobacteria bacterium]|nr:helix-turn-helix transcriptional regulator [Deltaproteobacteria bacterium]